MNNLTEPSVSEENKIEEISTNLYRRIEEETTTLLKSQLKQLGVEYDLDTIGDIKKYVFPADPQALAIYEYQGRKILGLRISDNGMGIDFDVPNLETQEEREVQSD